MRCPSGDQTGAVSRSLSLIEGTTLTASLPSEFITHISRPYMVALQVQVPPRRNEMCDPSADTDAPQPSRPTASVVGLQLLKYSTGSVTHRAFRLERPIGERHLETNFPHGPRNLPVRVLGEFPRSESALGKYLNCPKKRDTVRPGR